ncbi:type II toxin-antitoxin system Phd/YefM family antitoxin [Terasakiella sp. SH-1]|uniref:type II toxin-antitoxin system Phd/YefM family antitoxin n=1 Tax=Terasakiella sp. SH-1 TaxID=2560057 RepID=UPI0014300763|nr:type II toxin-antitoxin system Phd/YefM family antitoxin [Terasakiella sp. SH-1]
MKTISATSASKEFGRYLDTAQREPVIVTKKDRPVAVTMSIQEAQELFELRIQAGIQRGLSDVEQENYHELTADYAQQLKKRFKANI